MPLVRIAAVSLNQTALSWNHNRDNLLEALAAAKGEGAHIVCFPELCISGYGVEDAFLWPQTAEMAQRVLAEILPHTEGAIVSVGLPLWVEGRLHNATALLMGGRIIGVACKRHLAKDGIHYEPRWFSPWPRGKNVQGKILGAEVPVGDLIFEVGGVRIAYEICEDAWVSDRPALELADQDVDLILNPSASHFSFFKHLRRRQLVTEGARSAKAAYVYCNLLGNEAGRAIYDGDCMIARGGPDSRPLAESRRFSFQPYQLAVASVEVMERTTTDQVRVFESGGRRSTVLAHFGYSWRANHEAVSADTPGEMQPGHMPKEQALARALPLGLFDYLRKSGAKGFVISLSGGADSAAVALLVRLMVRLAFDELGQNEVLRQLNLPPGLDEVGVLNQVLCTVYQGTENSSETTRSAAGELAFALCASHHEVNVDGLVAEYRQLTEGIIGRAFDWEKDDITLQNIQSRARAPLVWMLANARQALLLATSNRSEAAVGYTTMDGDTAGGLCPIAGIDKAYLRAWLVYMERYGIEEMGPIAALSSINSQQPTAELRPLDRVQTDEGDLMPYDVLDVIERAAIVERLPLRTVVNKVEAQFRIARPQAIAWVKKFYRLFAINQWKRERFAPSFHADDGSLDPKTWCRFPILSSSFERELAELDELS